MFMGPRATTSLSFMARSDPHAIRIEPAGTSRGVDGREGVPSEDRRRPRRRCGIAVRGSAMSSARPTPERSGAGGCRRPRAGAPHCTLMVRRTIRPIGFAMVIKTWFNLRQPPDV